MTEVGVGMKEGKSETCEDGKGIKRNKGGGVGVGLGIWRHHCVREDCVTDTANDITGEDSGRERSEWQTDRRRRRRPDGRETHRK